MSPPSPPASASSGGIFDIPGKEQRLAALDTEMASPAFWADNRRAQELIRERTELARTVARVGGLTTRPEELGVRLRLAAEAGAAGRHTETARPAARRV